MATSGKAVIPRMPCKFACTILNSGFGLAAVLLGFDRQGWITVFAALLLALITLFTNYTRLLITPMSTSWEPLPSTYRSKPGCQYSC